MKSIQLKLIAGQRKAGVLAAVVVALCAWAVAGAAYAQRISTGTESQPYPLDTGVCANSSTNEIIAFQSVIQATGKPSKVRVHFSAFNLGKRSYIALTSDRDGGKQKLDRISMGYWQSTSAIFNGDTVKLTLNVAPGEQGIFVQVDQLTLGCDCPEQVLDLTSKGPLTLCGSDSRVASTD